MQKQINSLVDNINELDKKDEEGDLEEKDIGRRRNLIGNFWRIPRRQESITHPNSRSKWFKEAYGNTNTFILCVNGGKNSMRLKSGGRWFCGGLAATE